MEFFFFIQWKVKKYCIVCFLLNYKFEKKIEKKKQYEKLQKHLMIDKKYSLSLFVEICWADGKGQWKM